MPRKPSHRETFQELVEEAKATAPGHPRDGQATSRVANDGLWDSKGRFWPRAYDYLSSDEVVRVLEGGEVLVGVQRGYRTDVVFYEPPRARQVWAEQICDRFASEGDPGDIDWSDVAYVAELRRRPDGSQLLWFEGHC